MSVLFENFILQGYFSSHFLNGDLQGEHKVPLVKHFPGNCNNCHLTDGSAQPPFGSQRYKRQLSKPEFNWNRAACPLTLPPVPQQKGRRCIKYKGDVSIKKMNCPGTGSTARDTEGRQNSRHTPDQEPSKSLVLNSTAQSMACLSTLPSLTKHFPVYLHLSCTLSGNISDSLLCPEKFLLFIHPPYSPTSPPPSTI